MVLTVLWCWCFHFFLSLLVRFCTCIRCECSVCFFWSLWDDAFVMLVLLLLVCYSLIFYYLYLWFLSNSLQCICLLCIYFLFLSLYFHIFNLLCLKRFISLSLSAPQIVLENLPHILSFLLILCRPNFQFFFFLRCFLFFLFLHCFPRIFVSLSILVYYFLSSFFCRLFWQLF